MEDLTCKAKPLEAWLPALLIAAFSIAFCGLKLGFGDIHLPHLLFVVAIAVLYFGHAQSRQLFVIAIPIVLYATSYDFLRYIPFSWLSPIHVKGPYYLDLSWFGLSFQGQLIHLHEYLFAKFAHPAADFLAGFIYFLHIPVVLAMLVVFWKCKGHALAQKYTMAFLLVNIFAFFTYIFFPAAAPWYVQKYGLVQPLGPILGDAAGLVRFDQLFGISFYTENYRLGSVTFGAIPSMHAGFATLAWLYTFQVSKKLSFWMSFYLLGMYFSALYLQHHYAIDVVLGVMYSVAAWLCIEVFFANQVTKMNAWIWRRFYEEAPAPLLKWPHETVKE